MLYKDKKGSEAPNDKKEKSSSVIKPRHLNMEDMRQAANKVIKLNPYSSRFSKLLDY